MIMLNLLCKVCAHSFIRHSDAGKECFQCTRYKEDGRFHEFELDISMLDDSLAVIERRLEKLEDA